MKIEQVILSLLSPRLIEVPSARTGVHVHPLALAPGQSIKAEVLSQLGDNRYLVSLGQTHYEIKLPMPVQSGDKLQLRFLELDQHHQPVFLLSSPRPAMAAAVTLTEQAQHWQKLAGDMAAVPNKAVVLPATPLASDMPRTPAPLLAQSLASAMRDSGLFYESHVAAWSQGKMPLAQLLAEPQGRLSPLLGKPPELPLPAPVTPLPAAGMAVSLAAQTGLTPLALPTQALTPLPVLHQAVPTVDEATDVPKPPSMPTPPAEALAPKMASGTLAAQATAVDDNSKGAVQRLPELVQQQLQGIEQRQVQWTGQVWPDQMMHWSVEEKSGDDAQGQAPGDKLWHSHLRLDLPRLGHVEAELNLLGGHLYLRIQTDGGAAVMNAGAQGLRENLKDAGLQLQGLSVNGGSAHDG